MERMMVPAALASRLGHEASEGLVEMFDVSHAFATDRFERRLTEEVGLLRVEMERMRGDLRAEMAGMRGDLRAEMSLMRGDLMKWAFLLWVGQFAALVGALSFMLPGR